MTITYCRSVAKEGFAELSGVLHRTMRKDVASTES